MKATELSGKNPEQLNTLLLDLVRGRFNLRMQKGSGQLTKPSQMKAVRRDIARIKTVLQELATGESS